MKTNLVKLYNILYIEYIKKDCNKIITNILWPESKRSECNRILKEIVYKKEEWR